MSPDITFGYDFALLELSGTVPLSRNVSVICLDSSPPEAHIGRDMLISGWGYSGMYFERERERERYWERERDWERERERVKVRLC